MRAGIVVFIDVVTLASAEKLHLPFLTGNGPLPQPLMEDWT